MMENMEGYMDLQVTSNSIALIRQLMNPNAPTEPVIEGGPDKPEFIPRPGLRLPRAAPEEKGVPSAVLEEYFRRLAGMEELDMHSVTVLRDGAVIAEANFGAYDREIWHISYSECKSVTALAVGLLVDEGKLSLDDRVVKLLGDRVPKLSQLTLRDLTVRHLLTMTSGVLFNEAGSVTAMDWVRGFLESVPVSAPGEKFAYNSMNTYMLSAIVREVSGRNMTDYLREKLFEPLGMGSYYWERCPMGIEKGGWGLYMCQEDLAKLGLLVLNRGLWQGRRLISVEWIDEATSAHAHPPENYGDYDYGYQIWTGRHIPSFLFSGMFGQNVLGFTGSGLLIVSSAGNDEMFQQSDFFKVTHELLGRGFGGALPEDAAARQSLEEFLSSLRYSAPRPKRGLFRRAAALPEPCAQLDGRSYEAVSPNSASVGLAPLFVQALQNNYTAGLKGFSFRTEGGRFIVTVAERGAEHELPVGFYEPERVTLDFGAERHLAAVTGRFARNEDGLLVLILRVSLLETASARFIRFYFSQDFTRSESRWSERPGVPFLREFFADALSDVKRHPAVASALERVDGEYLNYRMRAVLEPVVRAELSGGGSGRKSIREES